MQLNKDNFQKFKEDVDRLQKLLANPEPGHFSWHGALDENMKAILDVYYGGFGKLVEASARGLIDHT